MFRYLTAYRFYTLAKVGLGLAYLWFIGDFFRIRLALWGRLSLLLPVDDGNSFSAFLNHKALIWTFFLASPLVVALYVWGRYRWLQIAVACWINLSLVVMTTFVGIFASTADVWLNYTFLAYGLAALVCPTNEWERCEPGFSLLKWRDNPVLASTYAWLVVLIQFTVYLFAGINKIVDGWQPWTSGVALQNLAFDSSMHDYARGIHVPYLLSLILCYVTLFQRLVVPLGFFFMRYRGWSVLILGSMHVGYDLLMQVAVFPLIGVSSLLMIIPPRTFALPLFSRPSLRQPREIKRMLQRINPMSVFQNGVLAVFSLWLLIESARVTVAEAMPWENRWVVIPAWRMFADGGVDAGEKWRLILRTPEGEVDATAIPLQVLPHIWRDRFYIDQILHEILASNPGQIPGPGTPVGNLLQTTDQLFRRHQLELHRDPAILNGRFSIDQTR